MIQSADDIKHGFELILERMELMGALKRLRPSIRAKRYQVRPAWLWFADGRLTLEIERGAVVLTGKGNWKDFVEITCAALRILDRSLPEGDPLTLTFADRKVTVAGVRSKWSCPARQRAPAEEFRANGNTRLRAKKMS